MKISCPNCQARYQVDLPNLDEKGVGLKCARCSETFLVQKRGGPADTLDPERQRPKEQPAELAAAVAAEGGELAGATLPENAPPPLKDEKGLDDYLDQIIKKELGEAVSQNPSDSEGFPNLELSTASNEHASLLDDLVDDIIQQRTEPETVETSPAPANIPEAGPSQGPDGDPLDDLLEEIIQEDLEIVSSASSNAEKQVSTTSPPPGDDPLDELIDEILSEEEPMTPVRMEEDRPEEPGETESAPATEQVPEESSLEPPETEGLTGGDEGAETEMPSDSHEDPAIEVQGVGFNEEAEEPIEEQAGESPTAPPEEPPADSGKEAEDLPEEPVRQEEMEAETAVEQEPAEDEKTAEEETPQEASVPQEDQASAETEKTLEQTEVEPEPAAMEAETMTAETEPAAEKDIEQETGEEDGEEKFWEEALAGEEGPAEETGEPDEEEAVEEPVTASEDDTSEDTASEDAVPEDAASEDEEIGTMDAMVTDEEGEAAEGDEEDAEATGGLSEDQYAESDEDYSDDEFDIPKKKYLGPIPIPATKTGQIILASTLAGVLLIAGGAYFAMKTFAPSKLLEMEKAETVVPDGLDPKPGDGEAAGPEGEAEKATVPGSEPGSRDKTKEPEGLAGELAGSKTLAQADRSRRGVLSKGLMTALAPGSKSVILGAIMPVAYDSNDIRVLSFNLEMEMSDEASAEAVRESLPVFEKIMVATVEGFLEKKFYNDVLYVKEKLQKRLHTSFNNSIEGAGKVKKVEFKDFEIQ